MNSKVKKQEEIVQYLYKYELLNEPIDVVDAFENYDFSASQLKEIEKISKLYPKLKMIIRKNLKEWKWERIAPLERSILLYGSFEMMFKDKALVINGMVMIAKGFIDEKKYKYINAILESIGAHYERIKATKK